jgi:hypothetical protein
MTNALPPLGWFLVIAFVFSAGFVCGRLFLSQPHVPITYPERRRPAATAAKTNVVQLTQDDRDVDSAVARYNRSLKS